MQKERYDLVIVGAGINGVGVAQAAAAEGYSVLLLEKNDQPGLETSSSSSKLIHGGLRYLESLEFSLVRESLKERDLLLKLAPDLVRLQTFNIPVYRQTSRSGFHIRVGLILYALLGGIEKHHLFRKLSRKRWNNLEGLTTEDLQTVFQYQDAQTDDTALVRAVLSSAVELGSECLCRAELIEANKSDDGICVEINQNNQLKTVQCTMLINAAGRWVEEVNNRIQPASKIHPPALVQGAHLIMKSPVSQAYYLEALQDGRAVFLLPWQGHSLLGTTETPVEDTQAEIRLQDSERQYLLDVYRHYFPYRDTAVIDEMAGCRVLPRSSNRVFNRSRELKLEVDDRVTPRVVSMIGGKLTVYRRSALKVMQLVHKSLPERMRKVNTSSIPLVPVRGSFRF